MKKIKYSLQFIFSLLILSSCADYLDVTGELSQNLTIEEVFENPTYTKRWYVNVYNCISEFSETGSETNAFRNPWSNLAGEIASQKSPQRNVMVSGYTASSGDLHRWDDIYKYIRQGMIFLERAKAVGQETDSDVITEKELGRMKDEIRYLIAYSYFSLFELYGPAPIVTVIDDPAYPEIDDYERPSVDEFVKYIDDMLADILAGDHLPNSSTSVSNGLTTYDLNNIVRPTKVIAMALRAKMWMYVASPLFNGGYQEALQVKNRDGKQLFPEYDGSKWATAKKHVKDFIDYAEAQGHKLHTEMSGDVHDPHQSVYQLFQKYNDEIIWAATYNSYSDEYKMEKRTTPRDIYACYGTIGPTQESVDKFFMENGLAIDDAGSGYNENSLVALYNPTYGRTDMNIFNMYANREPRFYCSVIYQGQGWYIQPSEGYTVDFSFDGGAGPSSTDTPLVGYMLGKFKNRTIMYTGSHPRLYRRPSIIYRLADFYLYYAEACNEINPNDPDIIEYLDKVRERAGIPGYQQLADEGKKSIIGDQDKQRKAIRDERFVELFCEGQRYFDIRRWMICDEGMEADQTKFSGMNEYGDPGKPIGTGDSFYYRTTIERRMWRRAMYLYPLHHNVITQSQLMVQNPGW